jgi:hypothetical protein
VVTLAPTLGPVAPLIAHRPGSGPRAVVPRAINTAAWPVTVAALTLVRGDQPASLLVSPTWPAPATAPTATFAAPAQAIPAQRGASRPATASRPQAAPTGRDAKGGGKRGPGVPLGPPERSAFGAASAAPAGTAGAGLWCATLLGLALYGVRQVRRHRFRFATLEPSDFVALQQRPG